MLAKACHIGKIITPWLWLRGKKERKKKTLRIMTRTRACALKRAHRWHGGEPYVPACWILIRTSKSLFGGCGVWRRLLLFLESSAGAFPAVTSTPWGLSGECGRMSARWMPRFFFMFCLFFFLFFFVFLILYVVGGESPRKTRWRLEQ